MFASNCILCGLPVTEEMPGYVVPKTQVHVHCQQRDGRSPDDISDALPCCPSRDILRQLGGSIVQVQKEIPKNQVWVYNREERKIHRYMLHSFGPEPLTLLPEPEEAK
jgi:hypothetical protein